MEILTTPVSRARHMLESQGRFPGGALPGDISESWLRSLDHGIDPLARAERLMLSATQMRETQSRHADLIRLARPELELLFDQIAGSNFMIALGSPEGVVLETLVDTQFSETEAGRAVVPGSVWTEELRGTNALGLCLTTRRPAQVYGGEHFLRAHTDVSCISAPIFDGRGGLAGVLDASSGSTVRQQHTAALVQMSAGNIENCLIRSLHERRIVLQFHPRPEYLGTLSVGMLVLDEDFSVHAVNRKGEVFLAGLKGVIGHRFESLFEARFEDLAQRLVQGETLRIRDRMGSAVSIRCVANRASFALAVRHASSAVGSFGADLGEKLSAGAGQERNLFRDVVFQDEALLQRLRLLPEAARQRKPVFICGETGTGKEIVARLAHAAGPRGGPFVAIDGRMVSNGDFEALFFGKGGATAGLLSQAANGTLFIDEVTTLPVSVQAALARVLDVGEFRHPVDGSVQKCAPFLVSTSSHSLAAASAEGTLLPSLRFRLSGLIVDLPSLRNRSDLASLALRFATSTRADAQLGEGVLGALERYAWPGNLHELKSVMTQAAMMRDAGNIELEDLQGLLPDMELEISIGAGVCTSCMGITWKESQCRSIREAVIREGGVSKAARVLGMSRTTIYKHLEEMARKH